MKKHFLLPIALALIGMTACTGGGESTPKSTRAPRTSRIIMRKVTFDYNYEGAAAPTETEIQNKQAITKPPINPVIASMTSILRRLKKTSSSMLLGKPMAKPKPSVTSSKPNTPQPPSRSMALPIPVVLAAKPVSASN